MKKTGVSQKAIICDNKDRFLVLRRTSIAPSDSDFWDLPGGDLEFGEDAINGIIREIKEETELIVENIEPFDVESHIDENGEFWVTIAYKCKYKAGKIKLSFEHNEYKWAAKDEFAKLKASKKIRRFIKNF